MRENKSVFFGLGIKIMHAILSLKGDKSEVFASV